MFAKMVDGLGEAALSLIEHVIVGERNDLDAAGLQGVEQKRRRVKLKSPGADGVRGRNRRLKIQEADVGFEKNVRHRSEETVPSAVIVWQRRAGVRGILLICELVLFVRVGRLDYSLVWDYVADGGESNAADLARIGASGGGLPATSPADKSQSQNDEYDAKRRPFQGAGSGRKISNFQKSLLLLINSLQRQCARPP